MADELSSRLRATLAERGPLTGADLHAALGGEVFALWRACAAADDLASVTVGRRYLRLDRTVEGFARLSPSILREFMTYTVVGLRADADAVQRVAVRLAARIKVISRNKLRIATRITAEAFEPLVTGGRIAPEAFCVLVAGDIVYGMAHDVPRRESSTQSMVEGSDLDLIVLVDDAHTDAIGVLDEALLARKWLYLRNPAYREEVDYVVKPFSRLVEQSAFDTFRHMVACKVFDEAEFVHGHAPLHERGRRLLSEAGVLAKLADLERQAAANRVERRRRLLELPEGTLPDADQVIFYTNDEAAEFEH